MIFQDVHSQHHQAVQRMACFQMRNLMQIHLKIASQVMPYLPSGKRLRNYGKSPCY